MLVWDALRAAAAVLALILLFRIGVVVFRAWRAARPSGRLVAVALPSQVANTAVGVALFILGMLAFEIDRIGEEPLWPATPLVIAGLLWANAGVRGHVRDFRPRGTPPPSTSWWTDEKWVMFAVIFGALIFGFAQTQKVQDDVKRDRERLRELVVQVRETQLRVEAEGVERRDQSCTTQERAYRDLVREYRKDRRGLLRFERFVASLTPAEAAERFNALLIDELPRARDDLADQRRGVRIRPPAFCEEPGIGLPNKAPTISQRLAD